MMSILYKASPDEVKMVLVDQAAGAQSLRKHSALDRAGGDRSEDRFERAAKCDARNGDRLKLWHSVAFETSTSTTALSKRINRSTLFDNLEETEHKPLPT